MTRGDQHEFADCTFTAATQACAIIEKGTGNGVGSVACTGGRRLSKGNYVSPNSYHVVESQVLDESEVGWGWTRATRAAQMEQREGDGDGGPRR